MKEERAQIDNWSFQRQKLGKGVQIRRKEIKRNLKKQKVVDRKKWSQNQFFREIHKIDKSLSRLIRNKDRRQNHQVGDVRKIVPIYPTFLKRR